MEDAPALQPEIDVPLTGTGRIPAADHSDTPLIDPQPLPAHRISPIDEEMIHEWHKWIRHRGWTPSAVRRAVEEMKCFARRIPDEGLHRVTPADLRAYAQDRAFALTRLHTQGPPPSLLATRGWAEFVRAARSFYGFAATQRRWISPENDPTRGMPEPTRSSKVRRIEGRVYEHLLHHPILNQNQRETAIFWFLAHGLGPTEVTRLRPQDVNLEASYVHVVGPPRGTGSSRSAHAELRRSCLGS
jgi:site-specific recombinase XerD